MEGEVLNGERPTRSWIDLVLIITIFNTGLEGGPEIGFWHSWASAHRTCHQGVFDTHKSVGTIALCSKKQWPVCPWGLGSDRWVGWDGGPTQILDQHLIIENHFLPLPFSWSWDLRLPLSPHQPSCKSQGTVCTVRKAHPAIPHSRHQSECKINSPLETALGLRRKRPIDTRFLKTYWRALTPDCFPKI